MTLYLVDVALELNTVSSRWIEQGFEDHSAWIALNNDYAAYRRTATALILSRTHFAGQMQFFLSHRAYMLIR